MDARPETPGDLGFRFEARKNGGVVISHHGRVATTLRDSKAREFVAAVERRDERAA